MIVVRAWPDNPPPHRPHVIDAWPRVKVDDYDYAGLVDVGDNVIVLDWDIAFDREQLRSFASAAAEDASGVLVAPYKLYRSPEPAEMPDPVWAANRYTDERKTGLRWVDEGEPSCHLFGFGAVYLPAALIIAFTTALPGHRMSDVDFAGWHYDNVQRETPIFWPARPVHLHYDIPLGGVL